MARRLRLVGGLIGAAGCITLFVPLGLLQLGPSGLERFDDPSSASYLFSHFGEVALAHAFFGVLMSSLLVFGGAGLYYGRPVGFTFLKSAVWLQLLYVAAFELACLVALPLQLSSRNERRALLVGATCLVLLAGIAAAILLLLLWRLLSRQQSKEED